MSSESVQHAHHMRYLAEEFLPYITQNFNPKDWLACSDGKIIYRGNLLISLRWEDNKTMSLLYGEKRVAPLYKIPNGLKEVTTIDPKLESEMDQAMKEFMRAMEPYLK